jgi:hypothetical protein
MVWLRRQGLQLTDGVTPVLGPAGVPEQGRVADASVPTSAVICAQRGGGACARPGSPGPRRCRPTRQVRRSRDQAALASSTDSE